MTTETKTENIEKEEKPKEPPVDVNHLLNEMQVILKVPKAQYNKFGEFYYRDAEDIMKAAKTHLPAGATLTCTDEIQAITPERVYVKATATLDYKGAKISISAFAREPASKKGMDEMQITGAASSYARKAALGGLLLIDDSKDSDATSKTTKKEKEDAQLMQATGAKSVKEAHAAKALGGSMASKLDEGQIEEMYQQALTSLGGCLDFDSLKKVWANYYKTRKAFPIDKFEDIQAKYEECKAAFTPQQTNGAQH